MCQIGEQMTAVGEQMTSGGFIALGIFLIGQLIAAVAWGASMNTKMNFMVEAAKKFADTQHLYSTKEEVSRALAISDKALALALSASEKQLAAMWKRLDELKLAKS